MWKHLFKYMELTLALSAILVLGAQPGYTEDSSGKAYQTVNDSQMAVAAAEAYSGLLLFLDQPIDPSVSTKTVLKTYLDSTTAFVSSQLNDRRVYQVSFAPMKLPLADILSEVVDDNPIRVEVILDSISGQLIQIDFLPAERERYVIPHITSSSAERQLARSGEEYLGLPETPPATSLLETIETALRNGQYACTFHMASRVTAKYLLWRQRDGEVMPVWVIECYGGFVIGSSDSDHMRNVYSAKTSEWLKSSNRPLPPLKGDDK